MKNTIGYLLVAFAVFALAACESASKNVAEGDDTDTGTSTGQPECEGDETTCLSGNYYQCVDGKWELVEECEAECYAPIGCVECMPGETFCDGNIVMQCSLDGSGYSAVTDCDAEYGTICEDGECVFGSPCEQAAALKSTIGCEYWAVDLDNSENAFDNAAGGQFAVAVANIGNDGSATVTVEINTAPQGQPLALQTVETKTIAEKDLYIFLLPRRDVDGDNITVHVDDGPQTWLSSRAFRLTSDLPVVAYQFNTLDQKFSNDASLLIPKEGMGQDHVVLGYPPHSPLSTAMSPKTRGYITIVGTEPDTEVTVTVAAAVQAGVGVDEIPEGGSATFTLGPFDVLNLETKLYTIMEMIAEPSVDFSGSRINADKRVAVFFGTDMSMVGQSEVYPDSCCAEHIEQQVLPSVAMGQQFVVSHSAHRDSPPGEMDYYRIMAYETATVTTSLPAPNNQFTLGVGEYRDFFVNHGFTVETTDGYLHVAQFLVDGQNTNAYKGDAALLYVPAENQRRALYIFTTGQGFSSNHAVISAPANTPLMINTWDVSTVCDGPFSDGSLTIDSVEYDFESWECEVPDGAHIVHSGSSPEEATVPIGVFVYGYYNAGSYAYPAGSDLRRINPVVVE